jgi:hypothetical protein
MKLSAMSGCAANPSRMSGTNANFWRQQMTTTCKNERTFEALSDAALDVVAGGINPQPLPPNDFKKGPEFKKGPTGTF